MSLYFLYLPNTINKASHLGWHSVMVDVDKCMLYMIKLCWKKAIGSKGYAQNYGDYSNTFSPITKMAFVHLFIYIVTFHD